MNLLIVVASARAAAFSALRAGLQPWCVDLFADLDLRQRCSVMRLTGRYPHDFQRFIEAAPPGPWLYTGGLENWPRLIHRWSKLRPLWGNDASVLRRARDPEYVAAVLHAAGLPVPALAQRTDEIGPPGRWLVKPRKGTGGNRIHFDAGPQKDISEFYYQEYIEGTSCSLLYLGDGRRAVFLGMTEQLIGVSWLHAAPFHYCGSIGPMDGGSIKRPDPKQLGGVLARRCGLRGLFGVDGVLRDGVFWPVEINPRYTASVEVIEYAFAWPILAWHADVFRRERLPTAPAPVETRGCVGKAILFAAADMHFPADGPWMTELSRAEPLNEVPAYADIPAAGQRIEAGRPILTLFAHADSFSSCQETLRRKANTVDLSLGAKR